MKSKAQWILDQKQIEAFQKQKIEHYRQFQYSIGRDDIFTQGYLESFIHFMRKRKKQNQYPFKNQKVIFYAATLFKRYYLVNSYICQDLSYSQAMICCIYLSLKFNEYKDDSIIKLSSKWKHKTFFKSKDHLPHYGDDGYSSAQLKFLSGIKFQTGVSQIITPIESMFHQITKGPNVLSTEIVGIEDKQGLLPQIQMYLSRCYLHKTLIFLFEGPKIALSIMIAILRSKKLNLESLGGNLLEIYNQFSKQIDVIISMLEQTKQQKGGYDEECKRINKIQGFKKPIQKQFQSPKFQPQKHDFLRDPE